MRMRAITKTERNAGWKSGGYPGDEEWRGAETAPYRESAGYLGSGFSFTRRGAFRVFGLAARMRVLTLAVMVALALAGVAVISTSCSSGGGGIVAAYVLDEIFGTETSTIYIDNAFRRLTLEVGEEFPLRIIHRQLRDGSGWSGSGGYGDRYYYEEEVSDECSYTTSDPTVVGVDDIGILYALSPGTAIISVKFDLPLQKADFTSLTVTVLPAD
ncbi:MAG: hypothetical protein B1H03_06540 [Planctomycetales bacterium 4484_113]|nr:MAG: hypothetical protein B1H03_06540 [Planctomycetales bacterium 4484_113]